MAEEKKGSKTVEGKKEGEVIEAIEKAGGIENLIPPEDVRPGRCGGCDMIMEPRVYPR